MFGITGDSGLRFSLFGIPVGIDWSFLLVPLLAAGGGWQVAFSWTVVVFVSVLLHELGHAIAMRTFGFPPRISLYAMGGLTFWPEAAAPTPRQSFIVSGSGPLVSITLGVISYALSKSLALSPAAVLMVQASIWVNLVWGGINLLPLMPLDGGNLLDTGVTLVSGKHRVRWVGLVSIIAGALVIAASAKFGMVFLGFIGVFGILRGWARWKDTTPDFEAAVSDAAALGWSGKREEAEAILSALVKVAATDAHRARAYQELAWVRLGRGDADGAAGAVRSMPQGWQAAPELQARLLAARDDVDGVIRTLLPEVKNGELTVTAAPLLASALLARQQLEQVEAVASLMLAKATTRAEPAGHVAADLSARLFHASAYEACLRVCEAMWKKFKAGPDAFNVACCLVKLQRLDEAMAWLHEAVKAGMPKVKQTLETDVDLEPLRARPDFVVLLERTPSDP